MLGLTVSKHTLFRHDWVLVAIGIESSGLPAELERFFVLKSAQTHGITLVAKKEFEFSMS